MLTRIRTLFPGLMVVVVVGAASAFVSEHYGGPTLLYALLIGMALNHLSEAPRCQPGIAFAARPILRLGVALLGARITLEQILALGPAPLLMVLLGVPMTIAVGLILARLLGEQRRFGVLTGGAVAICGASAAMAIASILPKHRDSERQLIFAVIGVTTLSTVAMIIYPIVTGLLGWDGVTAGVFLGGTIHDVAQVVGAGYMLGDEAGDTATFTKLLRVAMLVPTVLVISVIVSRTEVAGERKPPILPLFLIGFLALVGINSVGWIPGAAQELLGSLSRGCLVVAIAAIGVKASIRDLAELGWRPLLMIVGETVFLALVGMSLLSIIR